MVFPIGLFDGLGTSEMLFLGIIAILLFGERLPEVARTWGKKFVDFKKSVQGIQDELRTAAFSATSSIESAVHSASDSLNSATDAMSSSLDMPSSENPGSYGGYSSPEQSEDYEAASAPKFEPPQAAPPPVAP